MYHFIKNSGELILIYNEKTDTTESCPITIIKLYNYANFSFVFLNISDRNWLNI